MSSLTGAQLVDLFAELVQKYPIVSIEDGFAEDDFESWALFTAKLGNKIQIVGDDLTVTNPKRIKMAIDQKLCQGLLLKVNQIGSVTESIDAYVLPVVLYRVTRVT